MESIENKTSSRVYGKRRVGRFPRVDFLDLRSDSDIRQALSQLSVKGDIVQKGAGVFFEIFRNFLTKSY